MKADTTYAFRKLNRIAVRVRPILSGRHCLLLVSALSVVLYLPSLLSGYLTDDNWHRLEYSPPAVEKLGLPVGVGVLRNGPADLCAFSGRNPQRSDSLRHEGTLPWWRFDGLKLEFRRPITSLSVSLDYLLWSGVPFSLMSLAFSGSCCSLCWWPDCIDCQQRVQRLSDSHCCCSRGLLGTGMQVYTRWL